MTQVGPGTRDMIDWLVTTIASLQGRPWQVTLNANGQVVEATLKVVESERDNGRGHLTTITKVTTAKFRIGASNTQRKVFSTD